MMKVAKYEIEKQGEREDIENKKGSDDMRIHNKGDYMLGGRESYISNRGSEYELKEAIKKFANDENMQNEMKKLL